MQLESFLETSAMRCPAKVAIVAGGRRWTYGQIESAANRMAHAFLSQGIQRGDRVVIVLENCIEAVVSVFAVLKVGGVFSIINPTIKPDKLSFILQNCRARFLVVPARGLTRYAACWSCTPNLHTLIVSSGEAETVPGKSVVTWESFLHAYGGLVDPPEKRAIDVDLAALIYTSGSTGRPKGVMLSHRNMVAASTSITTYLENASEDIVLSVLPLSFDYGLYQVLMAMQYGGTVILERSFAYPHAVLRRVVEEHATGLPLVPTVLAMMLQMDLSKYDFSALRYVTNTGAALPQDHIRRIRELLPHVAIYSMYGLTECKRVSYLPPDQIDLRPGSVGKAMPNTEAYVVDDTGDRLGAGEVGELVVRGTNVMQGYWELPDETNQILRPGPVPGERVLYTGDLFRTDEDGFLYFVGRKDDMLKSRGEKVSPRELEDTLCQHPAISEAVVLGLPDPVLGQAIKAVVAVREGCEVSEREVLRHCAQRLEDFMVPQSVEVRTRLPRTPNGKIDKRTIANEMTGVTP
jgi:amino acid adenylation domain-containing protein